ncbi:Uncharacterised protein [Bordetella pertussis]|nr:Uncharacterised protein [Bordetella pertussis]
MAWCPCARPEDPHDRDPGRLAGPEPRRSLVLDAAGFRRAVAAADGGRHRARRIRHRRRTAAAAGALGRARPHDGPAQPVARCQRVLAAAGAGAVRLGVPVRLGGGAGQAVRAIDRDGAGHGVAQRVVRVPYPRPHRDQAALDLRVLGGVAADRAGPGHGAGAHRHRLPGRLRLRLVRLLRRAVRHGRVCAAGRVLAGHAGRRRAAAARRRLGAALDPLDRRRHGGHRRDAGPGQRRHLLQMEQYGPPGRGRHGLGPHAAGLRGGRDAAGAAAGQGRRLQLAAVRPVRDAVRADAVRPGLQLLPVPDPRRHDHLGWQRRAGFHAAGAGRHRDRGARGAGIQHPGVPFGVRQGAG